MVIEGYLTLKEAAEWLFEHDKTLRVPSYRTMKRWLKSGILESDIQVGAGDKITLHLISMAQLEEFEPTGSLAVPDLEVLDE